MTACKKAKQEKSYISSSGSIARLNKNQLLERADTVIKGKVVSKNYEKMTNPDGTLKDSDGNVITNCLLSEYTVEIDKVYKGDYTKDTINVMTCYGYGLSPDLILHGEDDKSILAEPLQRFNLAVGKDCILLLMYIENSHKGVDGYYPVAESMGYYLLNESGIYVSSYDYLSFSLDTIEQEIADAEKTANAETAANADTTANAESDVNTESVTK